MSDKTPPNLQLVPPDLAARNLDKFIQDSKKLTVFGKNLDWGHWNWPGVGNFVVLGTKGGRGRTNPEGKHLHKNFVNFAKAYIRYSEGENPSLNNRQVELAALRLIERALFNEDLDADPVNITLNTLNRAAQLAREHFKSKGYQYSVGQGIQALAHLLSQKGLTSNDTRSWSNPINPPDQMHVKLGTDADAHRQKRLPDERALEAIGSAFSDGFDLTNLSTHPEVYATSSIAMLFLSSQRGGEIHELTINAEYEDYDADGVLHYGWRYRSFKNKKDPTRIKWGNTVMEQFAKEGFRRVRAITEEPRTFARYCEDQLEVRRKKPTAHLRFYRHPLCPDVPDDQSLTAAEVCAALGSNSKFHRQILLKKGLSARRGTYTLNSLWLWVLDRLPSSFPYVAGAKNKRLKYSEALFCMHPFQLKRGSNATNPVSVWMPRRDTLADLLRGGSSNGIKSVFERWHALDEDGLPLKLKTHAIRHLLDTIEHEGTGKEFLEAAFINTNAGRSSAWQGQTYNGSRAEDKAEIVREALKRPNGSFAVIELPKLPETENLPKTDHWTITQPGPRSCADIELNHRSAVLATVYGGCEHDWMLEPCQFHKDCLNCKEHFCIKGAGNDDQERLKRLRALLSKVQIHETKAKADMDLGKPGAAFWFKYQSGYRERIEQLIKILQDPKYADGSKIRLADGKANSHLHRVLREVSLRELENKSEAKDMIDSLEAAYRENRPLPLIELIPVRLEQRHG